MPISLPDDLRQAVQAAGTPLKVVDPATGEMYVLVRESALADERPELSNAQLQEIARRNRPPAEWLEGDEEKLALLPKIAELAGP